MCEKRGNGYKGTIIAPLYCANYATMLINYNIINFDTFLDKILADHKVIK